MRVTGCTGTLCISLAVHGLYPRNAAHIMCASPTPLGSYRPGNGGLFLQHDDGDTS